MNESEEGEGERIERDEEERIERDGGGRDRQTVKQVLLSKSEHHYYQKVNIITKH